MSLLLCAVAPMTHGADDEFQVSRDIVYGDPKRPDRALQSLDVYWKDATTARPVVVYIHGGAWAFGDKSDVHAKPRLFALHDMAFISMNYRLRWEASLQDQLDDVVSVIGWIKANGKRYGLDGNRIVLMGHEAGGHLASLVATQAPMVRKFDLKAIRAVVSIDSSSYDITRLLQSDASYLDQRRHRVIFGESPESWESLSPIHHVTKDKMIPPFALLYVPESEKVSGQAGMFSRKLREAGVDVVMIPGNLDTTQTIDEELGVPGNRPTLAVMAFVRAAI